MESPPQVPQAVGTGSPESKRPKGILKNPSFQNSTSPLASPRPPISSGPTIPEPDLDPKEITLQNTLQNAGPRRRSSSNIVDRRLSRSNSGTHTTGAGTDGEGSPQLKWDEANLYLNEQQKSSTMKITEPKTPYAKQYNPLEDEAELRMLDAENLDVDELDSLNHNSSPKNKRAIDEDIPGLDIGEPEEKLSEWDAGDENRVHKTVVVEDDGMHDGDRSEKDGDGGEEDEPEAEKHRRFEEMRRRHYEMKDVKDLLGHPEELDEDDDGDIPITDSEPLPNGKA